MAANAKKDNSTTSILMIVIGILLAFASYMYVYTPCMEKKNTYNEEIDVLDSTIADREDKKSREGQLKKEIETYKATRDNVLKYFPADIKAEDDLLFCKEIEDYAAFYFTTKGSFERPIIFYADNASSLVGYTRVCQYDFATSYDSLIEMVDYVNYYKYRRAITEMSVAYDSGVLSGAMSVNEYYIVGGNNKYEAPNPGRFEPGNENPFATLENVTRDDYDIIFK